MSNLTVDKAKFFNLIGYKPMPHQREFHASGARFRCLSCGRRTGKSTMAARDREVSLFDPSRRVFGWIVGPKYDLGAKEFRIMWDDLIIGLGLRNDKRVKKNFNIKGGTMYIELPWGSRVEVRSAQYPDTLVGEGLDWVIMAEAAKHSPRVFDKDIRPALSDKRGGADFPTTPEGKNWFYKIWQRGVGGATRPNKLYQSWRFPSWVNTEVYPGGETDPEILDMKENTLDEWFRQEIAAEFTAVVGKIFGEFEEETHVRTHEFRPDWPNYIAFDWGYANPLAAIEFQVSPSDTIHVWREHYESFRTLEWHVETLKSRINPDGYRLDGAFGDAADPEAVEYVSQHLTYCQADDDSKSWLPGIRLMKRFLKAEHQSESDMDDDERPILTPRYFVDPACESHIDEMLGYKTKDEVTQPNEYKGAGVVAKGVPDHCLVAGTLVKTINGDKPIENVVIGDIVATRKGWKPVTDSWKVTDSTEVMELTNSDGSRIVGTPNHRVWTQNRGFQRIDALRYGDILLSWENVKENFSWDKQSQLNSGVSSSDVTQTQKIEHLESIIPPALQIDRGELEGYTKKSGYIGMGTSQRGAISTISTVTPLITSLITLPVWKVLSTIGYTHRSETTIQKSGYSIWSLLGRRLLSGTVLRKVLSGIGNMVKPLGTKFLKSYLNASNVEEFSLVKLSTITHGSAQTSAEQHGDEPQGLTTSNVPVSGAIKNSQSTSTARHSAVPVHVVSVTALPKKRAVYDLTVDESHEFFANGILVHNSIDAMRYALMHLFEVGVQHHLDEVYGTGGLQPEWAKTDSGLYLRSKAAKARAAASHKPRPTDDAELAAVGQGKRDTFFTFDLNNPARRF